MSCTNFSDLQLDVVWTLQFRVAICHQPFCKLPIGKSFCIVKQVNDRKYFVRFRFRIFITSPPSKCTWTHGVDIEEASDVEVVNGPSVQSLTSVYYILTIFFYLSFILLSTYQQTNCLKSKNRLEYQREEEYFFMTKIAKTITSKPELWIRKEA